MNNADDLTITNIINFNSFDNESELTKKHQNFIHLRIQQRNGKKTLTTIQGLSQDLDLKKITKAFKKEFACNGCIIVHPEYGEVIQLQGDQRNNVTLFLKKTNIVEEDQIKIHGF